MLLVVIAVSADPESGGNEVQPTAESTRVKREPPVYVRGPSRSKRRPKPAYGPPSRKYGPPKPRYGPPKPSYGPPWPKYGPPPKPHYGPPKPKYGPPKSKYGPPKHSYGPPKSSYGPPKHSYGPPSQSYGFGEPSITYGEPPSNDYGSPHDFLDPSSSYGAPSSGSFGEPPISSYEAPISPSYGIPTSSYGEPPSTYETSASISYGAPEPVRSYGSSKKTYARPPKNFYSAQDPTDLGNDEYDPYDLDDGASSPYETSADYLKKPPRQHQKGGSYVAPSTYFKSQKKVRPSAATYTPSYSTPYDTGSSYPDPGTPPSDYFAGTSSYKPEQSYDTFDYLDSYSDHQSAYSKKRPIHVAPTSQDELVTKRPTKKKLVKITKTRVQGKKQNINYGASINDAQVIVGGQYAEPPSRASRNPTGYGQIYDTSSTSYGKNPEDSRYSNYKSSNMAFSPQNVNDVFTTNKKLLASYQIEQDVVPSPSEISNIITKDPNYPLSENTAPATDVQISKSISHSYYAGTAPDPFYSHGASSKSFPTSSDVLSPNYYDAPDRNSAQLSEKSSQKFRDMTSIDMNMPYDRMSTGHSSTMPEFDAKIRNHRTQ